MVSRLRTALAAATLLLASASCIAVFGLDPLSEGAPAPTAEAGADSPVDAGDEACAPDDIGLPGPPPADGTPDRAPAYLAVTTLDLGRELGSAGLGFDLDRTFTTEPAANSCAVAEVGPTLPQVSVVDLTDGVDNGLGRLLKGLTDLSPGSRWRAEDLYQRLRAGHYGLVFRLRGWNGTPNDDAVELAAFPAIGFGQDLPDGGFIELQPSLQRGGTDGGDIWVPDFRFFLPLPDGGSEPWTASAAAWVRDGLLVARFEELTVSLRFDNQDLEPADILLHDAWVTGRLSAGSTGELAALLDGRLGGRAEMNQVIAEVQEVRVDDPDPNVQYACTGLTAKQTAAIACLMRDIRVSHCDDGLALPCDGLSVGARFEAEVVPKVAPARARATQEFLEAGVLPSGLRCDAAAAVRCQ